MAELETERPRGVNRLAARFAAQNGNGRQDGAVRNAEQARRLATQWLADNLEGVALQLGLPEVDDRYGAWRVALLSDSQQPVGEVMLRCSDGAVVQATRPVVIQSRLLPPLTSTKPDVERAEQIEEFTQATVDGSKIVCGDARAVLRRLPQDLFGLVITSPPYYNAKPEYSEYADYSEYLSLLRDVFQQCHRTLQEGRFLIVNASPILLRRPSRDRSSKRIPLPFHINTILEDIGFEFLDDIIWVKPAGAGWNAGRGRRFAADRHPLQYKPVPVTEYFLVYRKATDKLIDWNIRSHPDQDTVRDSRIEDGYEVTNIWYAKPAHHREHPAVFPLELIEKLVRYYSFQGDTVLDPFAGVGTVGRAALRNHRRFFLIDVEPKFYDIMARELDTETPTRQVRLNRPLADEAGADTLLRDLPASVYELPQVGV